MRRNIFYDKINVAYGNRKNEFSNDIFRRNFELPGVPKKTIHCLISCNVKPIKAISIK